jgi:RNA polymerase sigma-70 factor (ECF subfamily)
VNEAIVRRAQAGDHVAFTMIVDASIDRMFAVATLIARDRTIAEDAVQDAMIRAWRDLPSLRDPSRIAAWIARLTVNATYDLLRGRRRLDEIRPLSESVARADDAIGTVDRLMLSWAFGRLPVEQRAVVVLHYYVGLSLDEVSAALGIPAGTARSRLHAALVSMRRGILDDRGATSVPTPREAVR